MTLVSARPLRLVRFENGRPVRSRLPFDYVDPDLPTLRQLREQEGLDELWKFRPQGEPLTRWDRDGAGFVRPGRLALDGDRLYVGDTTTGAIHAFRLRAEIDLK